MLTQISSNRFTIKKILEFEWTLKDIENKFTIKKTICKWVYICIYVLKY